MSNKEATTVTNDDLKAVNDDILTFSGKIVEAVKAQGEIKGNSAEADNKVFVESLPEGLDEKQAKAFLNYVVTARNGAAHAAQVLGVDHMKANPEADSFSLKMKMFGRDHVFAKINRGTSAEDTGSMTVDVQNYDVGRNMGQHNLIVKHAHAAAREALKFD